MSAEKLKFLRVDPDLHTDLKAAAAKERQPLREFHEGILRQALAGRLAVHAETSTPDSGKTRKKAA